MESLLLFEGIPSDRREAVDAALLAACGSSTVRRIDRLKGGASGALLYSVHLDEGVSLLRIEGPRSPLRNPHQYECMRAAADAGVAPPIRHLDADAGVAVMDYIAARPLSEHPGGAPALVRAIGELRSSPAGHAGVS